jgi:Site-specific recombinase XerD
VSKATPFKNFDTEYIFARPDGQPIYPESIYDYVKRIGKKLAMPHITVHSLRHTAATLLLESGETPKLFRSY